MKPRKFGDFPDPYDVIRSEIPSDEAVFWASSSFSAAPTPGAPAKLVYIALVLTGLSFSIIPISIFIINYDVKKTIEIFGVSAAFFIFLYFLLIVFFSLKAGWTCFGLTSRSAVVTFWLTGKTKTLPLDGDTVVEYKLNGQNDGRGDVTVSNSRTDRKRRIMFHDITSAAAVAETAKKIAKDNSGSIE